jgi:hypothetical protein
LVCATSDGAAQRRRRRFWGWRQFWRQFASLNVRVVFLDEPDADAFDAARGVHAVGCEPNADAFCVTNHWKHSGKPYGAASA